MADAPSTLVTPDDARYPEAVGHHVEITRTVLWVSTAANSTAGKTVAAEDLGMSKILGVEFLGDVGADHDGTDTVYRLTSVLGALGADVALTGTGVDGTALDLDENDVAAARVVFRCLQ